MGRSRCARARNERWIAAGRARVERHALESVDGRADLWRRDFDKLFAVNVNAFWTAPAPSLAGLRRLARRDSGVHLVYEPPSASRARELGARLTPLLEAHGFRIEDVRSQPFRASHGLCIIGRPE